MPRISEIDAGLGRDGAVQLTKNARAARVNDDESAAPAEASERVTPSRETETTLTAPKSSSKAYEVALVPGTTRIVTSVIDYEQGKVLFRIPTYWDYLDSAASVAAGEAGYL